MGHISKIFESVPVEIQKRNGFDLSHIYVGSAKCGQLVPVLKRLLMPNTKFSLGCALNVELPPLATSFFGRIDAVVEVFYCPCSLLYGGFKQFISNQIATMFPSSQDDVLNAGGYTLPLVQFALGNDASLAANTLEATNDSLTDYFGIADIGLTQGPVNVNMLPFLAYHIICDRFYRNTQVTKTWFAVNPNAGLSTTTVGGINVAPTEDAALALNNRNVSLVWHSFYTSSVTALGREVHTSTDSMTNTSGIFARAAEITFPDNTSLLSTRQRPWARDYFTSALLDPQQGSASTLQFSVDGTADAQGDVTGSGAFTIASLRAANSLQKFLEANNLDQSYAGVMRNHFGVKPSDADLDEPMYIGRVVIPVYQKGVAQTAGVWDSTSESKTGAMSKNPYVASGLLGAKGAQGGFSGEGSITKSFKVTTFGYLIGLFSLVPHTMYNYGIDKDMMRNTIGDFPFPELQSVGMEGIKEYEIYSKAGYLTLDDWAYTQRYAYEKYINDTAHGELRPGKSLASFVLQRSFASLPSFGTQFTLIPQDALDGVLCVNTSSMNLTCWFEVYWVFRASMPLAEYCIPTLGDLKDTYTIHTTQGGSRL